MSIPPHLSERIQRRIRALETDGPANWLARACKEQLNALPLRGSQLTHWVLRADGTVLKLDADSVLLAAEEELDPLARYAVLAEAARLDPALRELVPPRPPGVVECDRCEGTGWVAEESCGACGGLGWHVQRRPIAEWMERIDRGDQLHLRAEGGGPALVAGRLAGCYVAKGGHPPFWSHPAGSRGRRQLDEHLRRYGYAFRFGRQEHVTATWAPNPTNAADPFESTDHVLRFSGTGSGGSYTVDVGRMTDGRYRVATELSNDWDPMGASDPMLSTRELDEAMARAEVEREMRESGAWDPFPALLPANTIAARPPSSA
jgi:hypothetical protein